MNQAEYTKGSKHSLYIVGGGRTTNKFYAVELVKQEHPRSTLLHTGNMLENIIKLMSAGDIPEMPIQTWVRYVEPAFSLEIATHLRYNDVILDSVYHSLVPGLSVVAIDRIAKFVSDAKLILVEDSKSKVLSGASDADWYLSADQLLLDKESNHAYFELYKNIFEMKKIPVSSFISTGKSLKQKEDITAFLKGGD